MAPKRVEIIGGGPAGLYAGNLLKQRHPAWEVVLAERLPPSDTYGFGVGLTSRTLRNLQLADPESKQAVVDAGYEPRMVTMRTFRGDVAWDWGAHNGALTIARSTLLEVLQTAAERAGVIINTGCERTLGDCEADLVIAADGGGSNTRQALANEMGESIETGRMLYIWVGLDRALPGNLFAPVRTDHGVFVAHAYPYTSDRSTIVVETDEVTWRAAELDVPRQYDSPADSDNATLAYLQQAFSPYLLGGELIGNRSRWLRYQTIRCDQWHTGHTVLLGDAARTAHYSLGSGTKLALEDAIELVDVLDGLDGVPTRLAEYERRRRPSADRLQGLAHRSHLWWEGFPDRAHRPPAGVALAYLSRGGNVPLSSVAETQPEVTRLALDEFAGSGASDSEEGQDVRRWVLSQPYDGPRMTTTTRVLKGPLLGIGGEVGPDVPLVVDADDVGASIDDKADRPVLARLVITTADWMGAEADAKVRRTLELLDAGCDGVLLTGDDGRETVLNRLSLGERIKLLTSAVVVVDAPASHLEDLVDGLVAARTDLVMTTDQKVTV